jgi:hypothetical protein
MFVVLWKKNDIREKPQACVAQVAGDSSGYFTQISPTILHIVIFFSPVFFFHVYNWLWTGFGLLIGPTGLLQPAVTSNNNISWIYTVYNSQWRALSFSSPLCLHQFYGDGFQRPTFLLLRVPELSPYFSHSNSQLVLSEEHSPFQPLKSATSSQLRPVQWHYLLITAPQQPRRKHRSCVA